MNAASNKGKNNSEKLSEAQKTMLQFSEEDIKAGRLLSQKHVDEANLEWLKTICFQPEKLLSKTCKK